jgi:molecular chaperone HscB
MLTKDPFDTLGVEPSFDLDLDAIERRHRELSKTLHPDRWVGRAAAERRHALGLAIEVNAAWRALKDPVRRAEALLGRLGLAVEELEEPSADPELLAQMMELRESLSDARQSGDLRGVEALAGQVATARTQVLAEIAARFAQAMENGSNNGTREHEGLLRLLGELRYYQRFLEEAAAIEDELS